MSEKMGGVSEGGNLKERGKAPNNPIHNAQEDLFQIDWDIQFFKNQGIPIKAIREMKKFIPSIEYINMMKIIKHLLDMGHEIELLYQEFIESEILKGYLCSIKNERLSFYWTKKILDSNNEINIGKIYEIINRLNSYEGIGLTKKNIIYILQRMLDFYIRGNDTDIETFLMELGNAKNAKGSDSVYKNYNKIKNVNHINEIILSLKGNLYNIEKTRPKKIKKYDYFLKYYLDNIDYINYHILKIKKEKDIENVIVTSIDNKLEINKEMLKEIKQHRDKYSNCYFDTSKFENGYEIIGLHELLETELSTNNSNLSEIEDEISKIEDEIFYAQDVLSSTMTYSEFIKRYPPKESRIKDLHKSLKSLHEKRETYSLEYKEEKFNDLLDEMIKGIGNILFTLQTSVKIEETEIKRLLRLLKHGRRKKKLLRYIRKIENEDVHKELFNDFIEECKINKEIDENQLNYFKFIDDNEYLRLFFAVYPNEKKGQTIQDRTKNIASYLEEIVSCLEENKVKNENERFEMFCDFITIIKHTSYRKTHVNSIYKILELMKEWGVILDNYVKHFDAIINENDLFDKLYAEEEYYLIIEYLLLFNVKKDKEKRMKIEEIIEKIKKGDEYIIRFDTIKLLNNMGIYFIPNN